MLAKFQLNLLVLATVAGGYALGSAGRISWVGMWWTLAGAGLTAFGAAAWNQFLERDLDARMRRTANRPLPAGRIRPAEALIIGSLWALAGVGLLALLVNEASAVVAALIFLLYVGVYTPLKRLSTLNTLVGAVPGALPPVLGWTAAAGIPQHGAWALFAILFVWQFPHLLSIAWYARDDFARAGFRMLSVVDTGDGRLTSRECLLFSLVLIPASLLPVVAGLAGAVYVVAAVSAGLGLSALALVFARQRTRPNARRVFFGTLAYLPAVLLSLWLDRWLLP
jgi:protoheme IX farnesyltransferase